MVPPGTAIVSLGQTIPLVSGAINQAVIDANHAKLGVVHYGATPVQPNYAPVAGLLKMVPGEYFNTIIMTDGTVQIASGGSPSELFNFKTNGNTVIPNIVDGDGGLHNGVFLDSTHHVWTVGGAWNGMVNLSGVGALTDYAGGLVQIKKDATGADFDDVTIVKAGGLYSVALREDGTLWGWGDLSGGVAGTGKAGPVVVAPTLIPFPAGIKITKFSVGDTIVALDTDGHVWTWGGGTEYGLQQALGRQGSNLAPNKVPGLPTNIANVVTGNRFSYAITTDGGIYGWGYAGDHLGVGTGAFPSYTAFDLQPYLKLPAGAKAISTNGVATHVILTDGTLWGWGDDAYGAVGDGQELDFRGSTSNTAPYGWDWGQSELMIYHPIHIATEVSNFTTLYENNNADYQTFAVTGDGYVYGWGRNKGNALFNGIISANPVGGGIGASYPNSWDVLVPMKINPFQYKNVQVSSPQCTITPDTSPCNQFNLVTNKSN